MKKIHILLVIGLCICLLKGSLAFAEDLQIYTWHNFQFTYPAHWAITTDQEVGKTRQIRLVSDQGEAMSLTINLIDDFQVPNEEYRAAPIMASVSFGLEFAVKLAGSYGESAISAYFGSIELANTPVPSARFLISAPDPEKKDFYSLECFHSFSENQHMAFFGTLLSRGTKGRITENPTYHQYVAEAYAIARSIVMNAE